MEHLKDLLAGAAFIFVSLAIAVAVAWGLGLMENVSQTLLAVSVGTTLVVIAKVVGKDIRG